MPEQTLGLTFNSIHSRPVVFGRCVGFLVCFVVGLLSLLLEKVFHQRLLSTIGNRVSFLYHYLLLHPSTLFYQGSERNSFSLSLVELGTYNLLELLSKSIRFI